jgi:hypothetical protein
MRASFPPAAHLQPGAATVPLRGAPAGSSLRTQPSTGAPASGAPVPMLLPGSMACRGRRLFTLGS